MAPKSVRFLLCIGTYLMHILPSNDFHKPPYHYLHIVSGEHLPLVVSSDVFAGPSNDDKLLEIGDKHTTIINLSNYGTRHFLSSNMNFPLVLFL